MVTFTQDKRPLRVTTPLGPNAFLLTGMSGSEGISRLYEFQLEMLAATGTEVSFDKLLGQGISVSVDLPETGTRHFHGICSRVAQGGRELGADDTTYTSYRLEIVPSFWLLTRRLRSRIFQNESVPDVLRKVLTGFDVTYEIQGTFEPRNYCTQYRETDFDFASRLMEEEGIFYFFKHTEAGHTMVVGNTPTSHSALPLGDTLRYDAAVGGAANENRVHSWEKQQELRSGKYTLWDHTFELPNGNLEATASTVDSISVGRVTHKLKVGNNESLELYEFPGDYAKRFDGVAPGGGDRASDIQKIFQDNTRTVGIRMQQEAAEALRISGTSRCPQMVSGHKFSIAGHPDGDGEYVLTSIAHAARMGQSSRTAPTAPFDYNNSFTCIPAALPFRPPRLTPPAHVEGCQTAVVVGPAGQEIFPDKYGRVKVQFHWDREGQKNQDSGCWIRVSTPWAGKAWGAIAIPRIGSEVVVDFVEGDPDRPLITGMVYNAEQMPPYTLPDNKTQWGFKSRSSLQGDPETFNELRFEEKKGEEEIYLHGEKNLNAVVENNETRKVGFEKKDKGDQTVEIYNNQTTKIGVEGADDGSQLVHVWKNQVVEVGKSEQDGSHALSVFKDQTVTVKTGNQTVAIQEGNRSLTVAKGNETIDVTKGNRTTTVGEGNETVEIKKGNRAVTIGMGNDTLTVKMGNLTTKLDLGSITEEAMQGIEMKVGQNSIKIDQSGVTIKGLTVKVEGTIQTSVKGTITQIDGSGMLKMKGGITMIG